MLKHIVPISENFVFVAVLLYEAGNCLRFVQICATVVLFNQLQPSDGMCNSLLVLHSLLVFCIVNVRYMSETSLHVGPIELTVEL